MYDLSGPGGQPVDLTVPAGSNLLLTGPPLSGKSELGYDLLADGASRGEGSVVVTNTQNAARLRETTPALFDRPGPVGVVDCLTRYQEGAAVTDTDLVRYVASPADMTGIGIEASALLEELVGTRGLGRTRVLFDSVSTLLLYADLKTAFRFLHVFAARVEAAGALGLFVVEDGAHESTTVDTLTQLYDGVLSVDADGEVTSRLS